MAQSNLLIICDAPSRQRGQSLLGRLLSPRTPHDMLRARCASAEEVDADHLDEADVVAFITAGPLDRESRSLLRLCEEADVAAIVLSPDEAASIGSALCIPESTDEEVAIGSIRALLHQQRVVRRLREELNVAQRFQGGLRGEINRIHDELQLAAMVQQEFLPRSLPRLHGVRFAALWRPANYVAGDIYDITRLDEEHVGIFLADAVGHGVPAALLTMVIARGLPTKDISGSSYRIVPPGEALARLNEEMIRRQGDTTRFATAVYAVVNCRSRTMRIASAGHPCPLLLRDGADMRPLETSGGLLGVFPDERFEEVGLDLRLHDRILLYSDGFELAFPAEAGPAQPADGSRAQHMPSKAYLSEFSALAECASSDDMIQTLRGRLDEQPGSLHQVDDVTLIVIEAGELEQRAANRSELSTAQPAAFAPAGRRSAA